MQYERSLTHHDAGLLGRLAEEVMRTEETRYVGEKLVKVLSGATILPRGTHKENCVSLYAKVAYSQFTQTEEQEIILVSPFEVNRHQRHISILSPLGLALIGKPIHSLIKVNLPRGHIEHLEILKIEHFHQATVA